MDSAGGWGGGGDRQSNQTSYLFDKGGGVGDDQGVVDLELGEELGVVACWVGWSEWVGGLGGWGWMGGWVTRHDLPAARDAAGAGHGLEDGCLLLPTTTTTSCCSVVALFPRPLLVVVLLLLLAVVGGWVGGWSGMGPWDGFRVWVVLTCRFPFHQFLSVHQQPCGTRRTSPYFLLYVRGHGVSGVGWEWKTMII